MRTFSNLHYSSGPSKPCYNNILESMHQCIRFRVSLKTMVWASLKLELCGKIDRSGEENMIVYTSLSLYLSGNPTWPPDLQKYLEVLPWGEVRHEELRYKLLEGHWLFGVIGAGDVLFLCSSKHTVFHIEVVNCSGARAGLRKRVSVAYDCSAIRTGCVLLDQQRSVTLACCQCWGDRTRVLNKDIGLYMK